jgi:hypothetical protein
VVIGGLSECMGDGAKPKQRKVIEIILGGCDQFFQASSGILALPESAGQIDERRSFPHATLKTVPAANEGSISELKKRSHFVGADR